MHIISKGDLLKIVKFKFRRVFSLNEIWYKCRDNLTQYCLYDKFVRFLSDMTIMTNSSARKNAKSSIMYFAIIMMHH